MHIKDWPEGDRPREIARQTVTPLVVYKNGRIVKERVEQKSK